MPENHRLINRELSWLEFNRRVLEEAQDPSVPLLERVKFLAIFSANLDEFYMVRVAGLKRLITAGDQSIGPDGMTAGETMAAVSALVRELVEEQHRCFLETLGPCLAEHNIYLVRPGQENAEQARYLEDYFQRVLLPVVTPLAVDPGHPFPHLANRAICLAVSLRPAVPSLLPRARLSLLHVPPGQVAPRFVALPARPDHNAFMLLEDVLRLHLPRLYRGYDILSSHAIRVTRDAEVEIPRGRTEDLMAAIEAGLRERRMGDAVRLQYDPNLPPDVLATLVSELELTPADLYEEQGFAAFADLFQLYAAVDRPRLKDRQLVSHPVAAFEHAADVWSAIRAGDILVHHPYHTFDVVTRLVQEAAADPGVLAIKMTLYRVSPTSPIAQALARAAEFGKEVTVLVELQARFDEEANIHWARALAEVGAHVVYGLVGYKTHCKACLIVRQEPDGIRRYCHLSTGNYNVRTAGVYGDLGLFTCRESFGQDLTALFNLLTGYTEARSFHHLILAPTDLRKALVERIRREVEHVHAGRPGHVIAKMNALGDEGLIEELYKASAAGVEIDLIVRGICCLRPGVPGLSDRIRVRSIVDRYLEHARIFYFENGGDEEYLLSSADWMRRNLDHRVEIAFPVLAPELQKSLRAVLDTQLADNVKARIILPDGRFERISTDGQPPLRSQDRLYELCAPGRNVSLSELAPSGPALP